MATLDPQVVAHLEWIGYVRPTGLVVSAPALVHARARSSTGATPRASACYGSSVEERELDR